MRVALLVLLAPIAAHAVSLSHSGYLLDDGDAPVNTAVTLTLSLSNSPVSAGETVFWSAACSVTPAQGYYSVLLGSDGCGDPLPEAVTTTTGPVYLEVQVGATKLAPRQLLAPVSRATYADVAGALTPAALDALVTKAELGTLPLAPAGTADATTFLRGDGTWAVPPTNTGPQGAQGVQGLQGPPGADGSPGANGSVWRTGAGAPAAGLGVNGDFYLDTVAPNTFYAKAGGTWTAQGNLQGSVAADLQPERSYLRLVGDAGTPDAASTTRKFSAIVGQTGATDFTVNLTAGTVTINTSGVYSMMAWGTFNVQNNLYHITRNDPSGGTLTTSSLAANFFGGGPISGTAVLQAGDVVRVQYANPPNSGGGTATNGSGHFFVIRRVMDATSERSALLLRGDNGTPAGSTTIHRFSTIVAQTGDPDYTVNLTAGTITINDSGLYAASAWNTFAVQNNFFYVSRNDVSGGSNAAMVAGSTLGGMAISGTAVLQAGDVVRVQYGNPGASSGASTNPAQAFVSLRKLVSLAPEKSSVWLMGDGGNVGGSSSVRKFNTIESMTGAPDYSVDLTAGTVLIHTAGTYAVAACGTFNVQNNFYQVTRNNGVYGPNNSVLAGTILGGAAIAGTAVLQANDVIRVEYGNPSGGGGTSTDPQVHFLSLRRLK